MAKDLGLDLIEVSRGATPPVCKLVDYNKFLFEQKSKLKKTKTKKAELKEFRLTRRIGEEDLKVRIRRGKEFLMSGNMVKYTVKFKGREASYPEQGVLKLKIIESELSEVAKSDAEPKMMGKLMSITLIPAGKK